MDQKWYKKKYITLHKIKVLFIKVEEKLPTFVWSPSPATILGLFVADHCVVHYYFSNTTYITITLKPLKTNSDALIFYHIYNLSIINFQIKKIILYIYKIFSKNYQILHLSCLA